MRSTRFKTAADAPRRRTQRRGGAGRGEAALAAVIADLGRYRGQSRFSTWTAKYAIHEVAAAAPADANRLASAAGGVGAIRGAGR